MKAPDDCNWAACDAKAEVSAYLSRPCGHNTASKPAAIRTCRQCLDRQLAKSGGTGLATRVTRCEACGDESAILLTTEPVDRIPLTHERTSE